jgi:diguanylate cyclase (GGDEF)-like protein/PAS domain S-box-containing protein
MSTMNTHSTLTDFSLYDYMPVGVFIVSKNLDIIYWNRCMEEWTGLTRQSVTGALLLDLFPNLAAPRYLNRIKEIFQGAPPTVFSSQLHKYLIPAPLPGGKFRIQYTVVNSMPTGEPRQFHALFSIQDVTSLSEAITNHNIAHQNLLEEMAERKKTEAALKETAIELNRLNNALREKSIRDGLTGLFNHRYFWQLFRRDFSLSERHSGNISCLLIDLDFFKKVNDNYGHLVGDMVLKGVARKLSKNVRKTDIVSRYGGEEFAIILPNTELLGAMKFAENIRDVIANSIFRKGGLRIRITASIGVSAKLEHHAVSAEKLLDYADTALYDSKQTGRDKVVCYQPEK